MNLNNLFFLALFSFLLYIASCNTTEPPPPDGEDPTLTLTLEDVSCTEAWIKLSTTNLPLPTDITLNQNNNVIDTINLTLQDTLLYIDSLLPNTNYTFHTVIQSSSHSSNELNVTTMDTTSNNFTWQTFTFGEAGGSALYDIVIIDENNIWAVGEIYMNDSLGQPDLNAYNAVHWDGSEWELKRIYFPTVCGQNDTTTYPAGAIFAFDDEIWISSSGDKIAKLIDGIQFYKSCLPWSFSINKIWGTSSNDVYVVGDNGNIAWYNGIRWTRIESGTETIINDIWGITGDSNELILYCPVSSFFVPGEKKILKITDNVVDSVSWNFDRRIYSVWTPREGFLYVCGEGVFENKFNVWIELNTPLVGTNSVRGNNINDIIIAGDNGFITHFNGVEWIILSTYSNKGYAEVSFKDEIVAICGNYLGQGLIEIGKRN